MAGVISLWLCNWRLKVCLFAKKNNLIKYIDLLNDLISIETYFTIINIRFKFRCLFSFLIYSKLSNMLLCWIFLFYICVRFCQFNFFPRCGWFFLWLFSLFMFFSFWYFVYIYFIQFWKWIFIAFLLYCNACRMKLETILFSRIFYKQFEIDSAVEANPHFDWEKNLYILP